MVRFQEAENRLIRGKFVCRKCKSVVHTSNRKVLEGVVTCPRCQGHSFKPKRKK